MIAPPQFTFFSLTSSLGQLTALAGTVLFALSFLLATRARWTEWLFGSLDRAYIAHHAFGGIAFILLLFHPLLAALSYMVFSFRLALQLLIPTLQDVPILLGILALLSMIVFLVITFYFFRSFRYQRWKLIHQLLGVSMALGMLHALLTPNDVFFRSPFLKDYMVGVMSLGLIAFLYRVVLGMWLVRRVPYTVQAVRQLPSQVTEIVLKAVGHGVQFMPGQFVFASFSGRVGTEWHPFSISSDPAMPQIHLSAKGLGDYTKSLATLQPGSIARLEGPYGSFTYLKYGSRQVWIAGGIGITPFLSMARALDPQAAYQIDLLYSVRTHADTVYDQELADIAKVKPNLRYHLWITERDGFLTANEASKRVESLVEAEVLLCGPQIMMTALTAQLRAEGLTRSRIHFEQFALQ